MKNLLCFLLITTYANNSNAQWTQKTGMPATSRLGPASFVIGNTAYIAGGRDANQTYLNDFWAYDSPSDSWTQKASVPIGGVMAAGGFAINNFGYICCGWNNSTQLTTLFKYDPNTNLWTSGATFPGGGRYSTTSFVINDKVYVGLGYSPLYSDLWEFDPQTNVWTQKASLPTGGRLGFVNFAINGYGYVGTGLDQNGMNNGYTGLTSFSKYDPNFNSWSPVASMPGYPRHSAFSWVLGNKAIVGGGVNLNASNAVYQNDFYVYDAASDSWTQSVSFPAQGRQSGTAFSIGNCGYIFGGFTQASGGNTFYNELWQYCSSVGIDENKNNAHFEVNYNAGNNMIHIYTLNTSKNKITFQLFDIAGKIIISMEFAGSLNGIVSENLPANKLANGIYFYKISANANMLQSGKVAVR